MLLNCKQNFLCLSAKVRRLYDIANILSSLQLIEKVHIHSIQTGRKPGFRWIGIDPDKLELLVANTQGMMMLFGELLQLSLKRCPNTSNKIITSTFYELI